MTTAQATVGRGRFKQAERKRLRLRLGLAGPAGSGKTFTALRIAAALGQRIAVICTEHGAAAKYAGMDLEGDGRLVNFDVCELSSFSPSEYTALIEEAGGSFDVLVIDSLSHAWEGKDGALELVDQVKSQSRNQFTAWKDVTPMHRRLVEAILSSPCHVIATLRSKQEYVLQTNDKGKEVPVRIGMRPVQREGMEYEFDVFADLDLSHILTVTKTRCPSIDGMRVVKPGAAFIAPVVKWLETGVAAAPTAAVTTSRIDTLLTTALVEAIEAAGFGDERVRKELIKRYAVTELTSLTMDQGRELLTWMKGQARRKGKAADHPATETPAAIQPAPSSNGYTPAPNAATHTATNTSLAMGPNRNGAATPDATADRNTHPKVVALRNLVADVKRHGLTDEQWSAVLHRYGAPSEIDLTDDQCDQLIAKLMAKLTAVTKGGNDQPAAAPVAPAAP